MENIKNTKKDKQSSLKALSTMFKWMGKYWPLLIFAFIFLYFVSYARTLIPLVGKYIIDTILKFNVESTSTLPKFLVNMLGGETAFQQLLYAGLVLILLAIFRALFIFFRRATSAYFGETIAYKLRNKLYHKLQNADYYFHSHSETGDLIQRCTSDVDAYRYFISDQIIQVARLVLLMSLSIWQMYKLNVDLMWISLAITPIIFISAIFYFSRVRKQFTIIEENEAKMTTHVQENVSGSRVVKAFANESFEINKFDGLNRKFTNSNYSLIKKMAIFWSSTDFICFAQFMLIAVFGIVYASKGIISLGTYTAFLTFSGNIIWPMRQLGRLVGDLSKATVAVNRLQKIIENEDEYDLSEPNLTPMITGNIKFEHVSFKFSDSVEHQLIDVNLEVTKGQTIAIVGKTGSGKSTLMNLLVRLLEHEDGHIYFDKTNIKDIEKHYLREHVGIILQEPFLFSKTVAENIGIADQDSSNEKVESVAKIAHVHEDIINFEKGYKTLVGERGVTLSGGQKQRVAIARMLLKPKPILIFDDSLSAVDTETDIQIRSALNKEWKDSTVFIITHRITTAIEADKIIVLEDGKVVESGTHDELIKREGLYTSIWNIQSKVDFQVKEGGESNE